jgi:hypothetical protein
MSTLSELSQEQQREIQEIQRIPLEVDDDEEEDTRYMLTEDCSVIFKKQISSWLYTSLQACRSGHE